MEVQKRFKGTACPHPAGLMQSGSAGKVRVAAYCRVSTSMDIQLGSLETQMRVFRQKIAEHPGWELIDIYADEGLSGTSVKKRKEFQRMVADVEAGKIDYIITKSISRFARNTVECLTYVRAFQAHGVQLLFEKENVDTRSEISEMLLTVLAAFAQEESKSISDHLKWGLRKRFEEGTARWKELYGYRLNAQGEYVIEPSEAAVVRRVFELYIRGHSVPAIARLLEAEGLRTRAGKPWAHSTLFDMMANERYTGDIMLQKYVSENHLTHRSRRNDETEVPSFYVKNHHVAIISHQVFAWAQRTRELNTQAAGETCQYPYADTDMPCPCCGMQLVRRKTALHAGMFAWGCFDQGGCGDFGLNDKYLNSYVTACYQQRWGSEPEGAPDRPVNVYWLDELVAKIELTAESIRIRWKDGSETAAAFRFADGRQKPRHVAERYRTYLAYHADGAYQPGRTTRDKSLEIRPLPKARARAQGKAPAG